MGFNSNVSARAQGPSIVSRAEWGSPEPDRSEWSPEYAKLNRVIIHHTAVIPGTDSAAAVRAIWQYHAKSLGWGDIGYNYLVDQSGRIYQGRYFDQSYAETNNVDVVAGHAYGNNVGTSGIAALGDFDGNMSPTANLIHSMGEMSAYKLGPYGLNPANGDTYGGNLLGHRDVLQTACPGRNLYANLPTIRSVGSALHQRYLTPKFAWQYMNQYSFRDSARTQPIDVNTEPVVQGQKIYLSVHAKNIGSEKWIQGSQSTPIRIGASNPYDRVSSVCSTSWYNCSRPAEIAEPSVAPGQVGSFNFEVSIPPNYSNEDKTVKEYFNLLAEGNTWMNNVGLYWPFTIKKSLSWEIVAQRSYTDPSRTQSIDLTKTALQPGQKVYMALDARNTGSNVWEVGASDPIRLGTSNNRDRQSSFCTQNNWISCSRPSALKANVSSGQVGTFEFEITAPENRTNNTITTREYFSLLKENVYWMNDPGMYWTIKVLPS